MAGRYGMSFAAKMIQEGKYVEAVEEATRAAARDDDDPAPLVERASAYAWLERYPEAVADLEAAIALDETAGVLETDVVDDAYFSALLGAAKVEAKASMESSTKTLARSTSGAGSSSSRAAARVASSTASTYLPSWIIFAAKLIPYRPAIPCVPPDPRRYHSGRAPFRPEQRRPGPGRLPLPRPLPTSHFHFPLPPSGSGVAMLCP